MSRFNICQTSLDGLRLIERRRAGDARGFLSRVFCADELAAAGWRKPIVQVNHTYTAKRGTLRGLHFQRAPRAEMKLVNCLRGAVWDVAVDLRPESPTYLRWHAEQLSADNSRALLIPEGFAHGFQTLSDDVELLYLHSSAYAPDAEGGVNALDARLAIAWPLEITELSPRDAVLPTIDAAFEGVRL
jgi:dTDP-4-dehydrorhamnose 3,5-epimerase